jgi:hypothetical protein
LALRRWRISSTTCSSLVRRCSFEDLLTQCRLFGCRIYVNYSYIKYTLYIQSVPNYKTIL